jgi:hypothetical protein
LSLRAHEVLTLVETRKDAAVKGSNRVELDWLLKCKVDDLVRVIRPLSAKSCEQYAKAILSHIGGPSFEELLSRIIEAMVKADGGAIPKNSDEYYFAVRDMFPNVPKESDVVGRLLAFTMQACALRLERHQARLRKAN